MSGNSGPLASTKGESTSSKPTKPTTFDSLNINKLFKGKTTEPVTKTVHPKHGMQSLGKVLPARKPGNLNSVKSESTSNENSNSNSTATPSVPPTPPSGPPSAGIGQPPQPPGWTSHSSGPPGHPSHAPNVPSTAQPLHEKNWTGGHGRGANYPSQRFAQEFPSLAPETQSSKGPQQNSTGPTPLPLQMSKPQDNQYGPGPILRPQTEGSWTQGGGRGMQRPPGPPPQSNANQREFQDRGNLGGPTPPPMSLVQGGHAPPPLGAYSMPYGGYPPSHMYPNSGGSSGGGSYYGGGSRYGMPAPPPPASSDSHPQNRERGRGPPPQMRPSSHFTVKPIIKMEDLDRMDEIPQDGGWASTHDDVDYNKKISFSDDEEDPKREPTARKKVEERKEEEPRRPPKLMDRQISLNDREIEGRFENMNRDSRNSYDYEQDEHWSRGGGPPQQFDNRGKRGREEDWRRGRKGQGGPERGGGAPGRNEPRDRDGKFAVNLPPRFQKQQQSVPLFPMQQQQGQRQTPSPVSGKERGSERSDGRDRPPSRDVNIKILNRQRVDSESSRESGNRDRDRGHNDRRGFYNEYDPRDRNNSEKESKNSRFGPSDAPKDKNKENNEDKKFQESDQGSERKDASKQEDTKSVFRKTEMKSWADEMEDELEMDYLPKKPIKENNQPRREKVEEKPKRVIIHQRKVEDMRSPKADPPPEQKQSSEPKKEKIDTSGKPISVWGEREERLREKENSPTQHQSPKDVSKNSHSPAEKEGRKSAEKEPAPHVPASRANRQLSSESQDKNRSSSEKEMKERKDQREKGDQKSERDRTKFDRSGPKDSRDNTRGGGQGKGRRWDEGGRGPRDHDHRTPDRDFLPPRLETEKSLIPEGEKKEGVNKTRSFEKIPKNKDGKRDGHFEGKTDRGGSRETIDNRESGRKDTDQGYGKDKGEIDSGDSGKSGRGNRNRDRAVYQARGGYSGAESGRSRSGRGQQKSRGGSSGAYQEKGKGEKDHSEKDSISEIHEGVDVDKNEDVGKMMDLGKDGKKAGKSPSGNNRRGRGGAGGNRLQGYGPPSDKNPFSSGSKDEEGKEQKPHEKPIKLPTTGPIPLMDLPELSPPNLPTRSSHGDRGARYGDRGRGMSQRMRGDRGGGDYGSCRGGGGKQQRGRGEAKPLMSLQADEWETETDSEDDQKKDGKIKKEGGTSRAPGAEKFRNQQHGGRKGGESLNTGGNQQNESHGRGAKGSRGSGPSSIEPLDPFVSEHGSASPRNYTDNLDSADVDSLGFQEVRNKKNGGAKEKPNGTKSAAPRQEKSGKQLKIKNPPYDPRSTVAPRFQSKGQSSPAGTGNNTFKTPEQSSTIPTNFKEPAPIPVNAWEKPITPTLRADGTSSLIIGQGSSALPEREGKEKEPIELPNKGLATPIGPPSSQTAHLDGTNPPVKTMIFENRNFKESNKFSESIANKAVEAPKSDLKKDLIINSVLEMGKDLTFGKSSGNESPDLDFETFDDTSNSSQSVSSLTKSHSTSKPIPLAVSRSPYITSHQPSPISPLAADLNSKVMSVRQIWDAPEKNIPEEKTSFHGGFGPDSYKSDTSRDFGSYFHRQSLQSGVAGYGQTHNTSMAAISKPDPTNSVGLRQQKTPAQQAMESQSHGGMSSPFAYGIQQAHQGANTFGGMSAIPSPPTVMYGSQVHPNHPTPGIYQAFPHVETNQVHPVRSGFGQFGGQTTNTLNMGFLFQDNSSYGSLNSYQAHSHSHGQGSGGGVGQSSGGNRISPGPLTSSGNGGVLIASATNSYGGMKSGNVSGNHSNALHHQQGYSQMPHHQAALAHPQHQHHLNTGQSKGAYSQGGIPSQPQTPMFIPYDPTQASVINLGQNYLTSTMRSGGVPPPSATPPVQTLQATSNYYAGSSGNQTGVFPGGSAQGGSLQQLHVAVPTPQAMQNLNASQHYHGLQFQPTIGLPGFSSQAAQATVSALNLGNQLVRATGQGHSGYMKTQMEMVQSGHQMKPSHENLMNQGWSGPFSMGQTSHYPGKSGGVPDRNNGNNMGNVGGIGPRKGNNHMGNMGNMKYNQNPGYPGQKSGRYSAPGPIQRPMSTSPSTGSGPVVSSGSSHSSAPLQTAQHSAGSPGQLGGMAAHIGKSMGGGDGEKRGTPPSSSTDALLPTPSPSP